MVDQADFDEFRAEFENFKRRTSSAIVEGNEAKVKLENELAAAKGRLAQAEVVAQAAAATAPLVQAKKVLLDPDAQLKDKLVLIETEIGKTALKQVILEEMDSTKTPEEGDNKVQRDLKILLMSEAGQQIGMVLETPSQAEIMAVERKKMPEDWNAKKRANLALGNLTKFGGDPEKWDHFSMLFRSIVQSIDYTDLELRQAFLASLEGDAIGFYSANEVALSKASFVQLVDAFDREYSRWSHTKNIYELHTMKQAEGESVSNFANRIKIATKVFLRTEAPAVRRVREGNQAKLIHNPLLVEETFASKAVQAILDRFHVFYFIQGLLPRIRSKLRDPDYVSLEAVVTEAKGHEMMLAMELAQHATNHLEANALHKQGRSDGRRRSTSPGSQQGRSFGRWRASSPGPQKFLGKCHHCHKVGHKAIDCFIRKAEEEEAKGKSVSWNKNIPQKQTQSHALKAKASTKVKFGKKKNKKLYKQRMSNALEAFADELLSSTEDEDEDSSEEDSSEDCPKNY